VTDQKPSPLISPEVLARRLGDSHLRILDVRWVLGKPGAGRDAYDAGHIPGAVFVDVDTALAAPDGPGRHPLPSPAEFRATMESLGVASEDEVVAYDDAGGTIAARLWWMLDDLGHRRVSVLDGGYPAWVAAGLPTTTEVEIVRVVPPGGLGLNDAWTKTIDRETLAGELGRVVLLDARAEPRYRGDVEPIDRVAGHIPTAISAPSSGSLGPDGRMLHAGALAARFGALGANSGTSPVVTSCGSGITACHISLAMRAAGLADPLLYAGSYSDWTQSDMPVAVGPEPGPPPG
jgi:thiosulfate/3-mercaptopyruvate sulfurtransferase